MKGFLFAILFGFLTLLTACGSTEPIQLSIPTNFDIEETILMFDEVENATKYRIETTRLSDDVTQKYFVEINQNLEAFHLVPGVYEISIQAVGDQVNYTDSSYSDSIIYTQDDPYLINEIEGLYLTDDIMIRWFGRTSYQESTESNAFYFTASGFEVSFYGTSLEAELITGSNTAGKMPHLVVFIDGENDPTQGTLIIMDQLIKTYTLASELEDGMHTVKVLKRSESIDSNTALSKISTDGYFVEANLLRDRKIEVIAASSSAGFGNLALSSSEAKTTQNSDGLRAYAFLAARILDAEINIFSASGWPLVKGPWTGTNNIPTAYDYVNVYSTVEWNHNQYDPNVVIINLGTNDWSYINSLSTTNKAIAIQTFIDSYVDFIEKIHELHPNAAIVVLYGLMNETNIYTPTLDAVVQAQEVLPNVDIFSIQLISVNAADGIGSSNHPSVVTHIKAGQELADALSSWMGWNQVYSNIS